MEPSPDPAASRAVLLGVSGYQHLEPLPGVAGNLRSMRTLLTDPSVWGLPPANCVAVPDPERAGDILDAVREACLEAEDTLLVYFSGHGLIHPRTDELLLALPSTRPDRPYDALSSTGYGTRSSPAGPAAASSSSTAATAPAPPA